ncbi:hypothetical protein CPLU01_14721 [Colletotrichum plurivorum]|uniref:Uncharacterized protein n=1 Tax=Colletotrichum plurivorum TaxID=2175906 RepID=A0A8H6MYS0_9PEZI|nr:hypothetical protein CPLU01_14721 [Colletotrichum plurivorum]
MISTSGAVPYSEETNIKTSRKSLIPRPFANGELGRDVGDRADAAALNLLIKVVHGCKDGLVTVAVITPGTPSITRLKLHKLHITQYLAEELTRMADPFSIVSGAVGLVSGRIQNCVGVRKYLNAIKDRHKELAAAWDAARALAAVLENLNGVIGRLRDERPVEAALLLQCREGAQGPLLELRDVVARLEGFPKDGIPSLQSVAGSSLSTATNGSGDIMRKTKNTGRSMIYRIHQEDVKDLRVALQQLVTTRWTWSPTRPRLDPGG